MRRALLVALGSIASFVPAPLPGECPLDGSELHCRADAALQSMLVKFWERTYLRHGHPANASPTWYWTFAQGFDALLDGVERTGGKRYTGLVETFFLAQAARGWFNGWYDDMNWMALALIRAYDLTSRTMYLSQAAQLFREIQGGWDTSCCGGSPGGIWWDTGHSQKATASNAGPVITGVRLYERLQDESYLQFARQVYRYWLRNMVTAKGGVIDHINPDGSKVYWVFTYNEGLMIGAAVELFLATGEEQYLADAQRTAGFMVSAETRRTALGAVLSDGSNASCDATCSAFKGVAFRYLARLHEIAPDDRYGDVLRSSAEAIWQLARHPSLDLFSVDWGGPPTSTASLPQTAAAVMALNIDARMNSEYPGSDAPAHRYEAEDATIHDVLLRNTPGEFTGWGYVTGWDSPNQAVLFRCRVERGGTWTARFRYSSGGSDASRRIRVDGVWVADAFVFPATSSWVEYSTVDLVLDLEEGVHNIGVFFDGSPFDNHGGLNLDNLTMIEPPIVFVRGDCNADGAVDISDAVCILTFLFLGGRAPGCRAATNADGAGEVDITDPTYLLTHLFLGGPAPHEPFPDCGIGTLETDRELGCVTRPKNCQ